jgi:hypothetical protein
VPIITGQPTGYHTPLVERRINCVDEPGGALRRQHQLHILMYSQSNDFWVTFRCRRPSHVRPLCGRAVVAGTNVALSPSTSLVSLGVIPEELTLLTAGLCSI